MQKKNIRCTPKGRYIIETLPVKELMDLEYTGRLEKTLQDIEKGSILKQEFLEHIKTFVSQAVQEIKTQNSKSFTTASKEISKPAIKTGEPSSKEAAPKKREVLGVCPLCGGEVVEGTKGFGCLAYKKGCKFVIWKDTPEISKYNKKITKTFMKAFLKNKEAVLKNVKGERGETLQLLIRYKSENTEEKYRLVVVEQ